MGIEDGSRKSRYEGLPLLIKTEINEIMQGRTGFSANNCGDLFIYDFKFSPKDCKKISFTDSDFNGTVVPPTGYSSRWKFSSDDIIEDRFIQSE
jgi:hypothetical protein